MSATRFLTRCAAGFLVVLASAVPTAWCQTVDPLNVLGSSVGAETAVRFYYDAMEAFRLPLVFYAVPAGDPRLNTMPFLREGMIAYVTQPEMRRLLNGLSGLGLKWRETPRIVPLGPGFPGPLTDKMVITVLSSRGTAVGDVGPSEICEKVVPLQSVLTRPRARWEFQYFLSSYGCKVPGYDRDAFSFKGETTVW
jgi:hypothetical protein